MPTSTTTTTTTNCPHCGATDLSRGGLSTHIRIKHPEHHKPRPKPKSRADRLADAMEPIGKVIEACESVKDNLQTWLDQYEEAEAELGDDAEMDDDAYLAKSPIPSVDRSEYDAIELSEVESLLEEMESWRDNMEDRLSHTQKYEEVSDCCDTLESLKDALEEAHDGLDNLTLPNTPEDVRDTIDELEQVIESLNNAQGEDVMFPGMF